MTERTFVLTDVESSTALWERHPEHMSEAIVRHEVIVADAVARHGGTLVRERGEGDSLFAVFSAARGAVAAAADFTRELATAVWPEEAPLRVRVAVYTGEAEERDGDYYGTTVNRAARVRSLAFGGQILLGEATSALVDGSLPNDSALVDLGPRALKDLAEPEHIYELRLLGADVPAEPLNDADASNVVWADRLLSTGFVDRDEQRRSLVQTWAAAAAGGPMLALVDGEPGIGKTSLAATTARHAELDGATVLYGRWDEDILAPFQALREALGTYARRCPRSILRADLRDIGDEVARLLPEVVKRADVGTGTASSVAEAERLRLFEAIDAWLVAIASRRPVCLVLDDLQWADRSSFLYLLHLVRSGLRAPILVIATFRRQQDPDGELVRFIPELTRETNVRRIGLDGFGPDDVAHLIERMGGKANERSADLARELQVETGGNPLFLRELVHHLVDTGTLEPSDTRRGNLPESVRELVRWRLRPLPPEAKEALAVAAVIGHEFDAEVLARTRGVAQDVMLGSLEACSRAGILHEASALGDRFAFSHAIVRHALLDDLTGARRAGYHWRIGDVLEEREPDVSPAELAYHFCAAVTPARADRAIAYACAAGVSAMAELAYETAILWFRRALEVQGSMRPADGVLRCEILLMLGEAHDRAGDYASRAERFAEAADDARRLARADLFARAALGYRGVLPAAASADPESQALLEEALERLGPDGGRLRALVLGRLAHTLQLVPPRSRRAALADEAVAIARGLGDPRDLAETLIYRCWALDGPDDLKDQLAAANEIRTIAEATGDKLIVLRALHMRSDALLEAGDMAGLRQTVDELKMLADELRYPEYTRIALAWDAVFAGIEGRYDEAIRVAGEVHALMQRMGHPQTEIVHEGMIFPIRWLRGEMAELLPMYEPIAASLPEVLLVQLIVAWACAEAGLLDRARAALDAIPRESVEHLDKNFVWWATMAGLSDAVALLGDRAWAQLLYELVLPYADRFASSGSTSFVGCAHHHLGTLASTLERFDEAIEHFECALEIHAEIGARPFLALTQISFAGMLSARGGPGDRERSDELSAAALATADELGLGAVRKRAARV